ncbi:MAG: energy transducer TonB [Cyclobacteriaceae bacterium]
MDTLIKQKKVSPNSQKRRVDDSGLDHLNPVIKELVLPKAPYSLEEYQSLLDLKRDRDSSQNNSSKMFLSLGLVLSLLFTITAFEWKFYDNGMITDLGTSDMNRFEETLDIPNTSQPPPPPPSNNQPPIIREVEDEVILEEIKLSIDAEMTENTSVEEVIYVPEVELEEEKAEEIFTIVEQRPEPIGGMQAFYKYVADEMEYPAIAKRTGVQGKVYLRFVVDTDGSIANVEVLKGIGAGCDEEAVRVVENAPKWIPGKQRGRAVKVYMTLPMIFVLKE